MEIAWRSAWSFGAPLSLAKGWWLHLTACLGTTALFSWLIFSPAVSLGRSHFICCRFWPGWPSASHCAVSRWRWRLFCFAPRDWHQSLYDPDRRSAHRAADPAASVGDGCGLRSGPGRPPARRSAVMRQSWRIWTASWSAGASGGGGVRWRRHAPSMRRICKLLARSQPVLRTSSTTFFRSSAARSTSFSSSRTHRVR